jgi:hypothetical protein
MGFIYGDSLREINQVFTAIHRDRIFVSEV